MLLEQCDCKWKVSWMCCKNTMDTIYQTQCQSGTHEAQSIQWPPDTSDLILTPQQCSYDTDLLSDNLSFPDVFDWKQNVWKIKFFGSFVVVGVFLRSWCIFKVDKVYLFSTEKLLRIQKNFHIKISQTDNTATSFSKQTTPASLLTKQTISFHWSRNWLVALYLLTMVTLTANYNRIKNTPSFIPCIISSKMSQQERKVFCLLFCQESHKLVSTEFSWKMIA